MSFTRPFSTSTRKKRAGATESAEFDCTRLMASSGLHHDPMSNERELIKRFIGINEGASKASRKSNLSTKRLAFQDEDFDLPKLCRIFCGDDLLFLTLC